MKIMRLAIAASLLIPLLASSAVFAQAPMYPHFFYGSVQVYSEDDMSDIVDALEGTVITAEVGDEVKGSLTTTIPGQYGGPSGGDPKLMVQDTIPSLSEITFYVDGNLAEEVRVKEEGEDWKDVDPEWVATFHSGEVWGLDLTAKLAAPRPPSPPPPPPPGGGGGPPGPSPLYIDVDMMGDVTSYRITDKGCLREEILVTSDDGKVTLNAEFGVCILCDDELIDEITITEVTDPPPPPEGANIIGLAYDFDPDCAEFSETITIIYTYDQDDIPDGIAEEDLLLAYYDEDLGEWVVIDSDVDADDNTVEIDIIHFTNFAILGFITPPPPPAFSVSNLSVQPAEVQPEETVTITLSVTNSGGREGNYRVTLKIDGVKETEKIVTLAPDRSQEVIFTVTRADPGSYSVDVNGLPGSFTVKPAPPAPPEVTPPPGPPGAPPAGINWAIVGPIIAVAIFLAIFLPLRRRRRAV